MRSSMSRQRSSSSVSALRRRALRSRSRSRQTGAAGSGAPHRGSRQRWGVPLQRSTNGGFAELKLGQHADEEVIDFAAAQITATEGAIAAVHLLIEQADQIGLV